MENLSREQTEAYRAMTSFKQNFFLTGRAGSGKTHLLRQVIRDLLLAGQNVRVAAFTGLAAQHLGGTTLSKLLGLKLAKVPSELAMVNFRQAERNLTGVDVLVIDEISMVSGDTLELIDLVMREAMENDQPFGGIRIIFCGDFLQLPPIRGYGQKPFQRGWAFEYEPFQDSVCLFLQENHRQVDSEDLQLLNEFREGCISSSGQKFLAGAVERPLQDPVFLYPKRDQVERVNTLKLEEMSGPTYTYQTTTFPGTKFDLISGILPIGQKVVLKKGAPVIVLTNDPQGQYVNGSQGKVIELFKHAAHLKLNDGKEVRVPLKQWEVPDPLAPGTVQVRGMPLQLGWAATIHRAQGMTLDAVQTDLHRCWEAGQAYVALSRTRSLSAVSLTSLPRQIRVDPVALSYVRNLN